MDWLNIHTSVLDSAEFITAEPVDRSTWLCLQRYCIGQENSGSIVGAKAWTDRIWLQTCGVSLKEVRRSCGLWHWHEDNLVVSFYNIENEKKVQRLRGQAANAGHASWRKRGSPTVEPTVEPHGSGDGTAKGKERKGKEKEGKETPPTPNGRESHLANGSDASPRRGPKTGAIIPTEQPEPLRSRLLLVGGLKGRPAAAPWSLDELEAFQAARLHDCSQADLEAQVATLRPYYQATIPRGMDRRRQDLKALLHNWPGELDRARAFKRENNDGIQKV